VGEMGFLTVWLGGGTNGRGCDKVWVCVYCSRKNGNFCKRIQLVVGLLPFHALQSIISREILISKAELDYVLATEISESTPQRIPGSCEYIYIDSKRLCFHTTTGISEKITS
jgi:hypothetical protein